MEVEVKVKRGIFYIKKRDRKVGLVPLGAPSRWDTELYYRMCAQLAQEKTVRYLLKRIIKVQYGKG